MVLDELEERLTAINLDTPACRGQDGSDSGVEVNSGPIPEVTPVASCDSSLISCCYSSEDLISQTLQLADERELGDGTSEGGSESSSVASNKPKTPSSVRRKCTPNLMNRPSRSAQSPTTRSRTPMKERSLSRTPSSNKNTPTSSKTMSAGKMSGSSVVRSISLKSPASDQAKLPGKSVASRVKSPLVSSSVDDGRWPSSVSKSQTPTKNKLFDKKFTIMTSSVGPIEGKSSTFDKYATLPRRRRKSAENLLEIKVNRDPSLNRTASLRKKKVHDNSPPTVKSLPPYPSKQKSRTRIYHETCVQTALTGQDVDKALEGIPFQNVHNRVETKAMSIQVDRRFELAENLEAQVKQMQEKVSKLLEEKKEYEKIKCDLKEERELRQSQEKRLRALLHDKNCQENVIDSVEKQCILTNDICKKQQQEIIQLQTICCNLKRELDKSLLMQHKIIQQQQEVEAESLEMQEFLQAEKSTLADTLKELENEVSETKQALLQKEAELIKQQEDCTHLVRISEQIRQEKLSVEARLKALDVCSREAMLQHGAAVSGASVALSGLGSRLENLVEALVSSYNISERDLEDVIFHNEAYSQSSSTGSSAASESNSPQHKSSGRGFMSAIINAIRSATLLRSTPDTFSDAELLAAEPEPASFHRDLTTTSSPGDGKRHSIASLPSLSDLSPMRNSHRTSFAASDDFELCGENNTDGALTNSESLQNLSQAILQRQKQEEEVAKDLSIHTETHPSTLVDQVIEVDNLVTKLLKVLQIIQLSTEKQRLSSYIISVGIVHYNVSIL
ncbi:hypothetical protein AAG570_000186 [Ranatra chinensis]|uniref:Uncharacterized protein n=1 Tax=Ranatra chinensis TaxID=642074 RepID=A0ABD0YYH5_9HEMI